MTAKKIDQEALNDSARILAFAFLKYWEEKNAQNETKGKES